VSDRPKPTWSPPRPSTWLAAGAPALVALIVYVVFSVTRHVRFGSGSWDMGCYVHNLFLLGFAQPPVSSVLGDANFWGGTNHFMPSLYLVAPLAWTGATSSLLVVQAAVVALAVVPLAWLAERRGLGPCAIAAVSVAFLFAVGTQSFIEFDVHEVAPVPFLLFTALLAFDLPPSTRTRVVAFAALVVLAGCKESAIAYAAAACALAAVAYRAHRVPAAVGALAFTGAFVLVVRVIQPALLEPGGTMLHEGRFAGGLTGLVGHIVAHPFATVAQVFAPAPKASTLANIAGTFAFLPALSPAAWLLAAPNLVERFLSDKREMWGLGFHYSLYLVAVCAYGAVLVLGQIRSRVVLRMSERAVDGALGAIIAAAFVASIALSPVTPEFASLHKPYMADDARVERYRRALAIVPDDAKVVAQNHFLPHLAFRRFIWQPYEKFVARADYVILDVTDSPWPHSARHVADLDRRLAADPAWRAAFSEGSTRVYARVR
jgi:uncharacterized membrane protein